MPEGLSFERAAMLEPLAIMVHAIGGVDIKINDTVVMFGSGVMGLMGIKALKATGAGKVIVVEVDEFKKEMARKNGADYIIDGREDVPARIKELTDGLGADYAFDTAGVKATISNAFHCLKKNGTLVQVGNISPTVESPLQTLVNSQIHWIGRYGTFTEYEGAMHLIASGKVNVDDCLSKVAPLKDGQEWFERLHAMEPGLLKVVLVP
jgi:threonine dehydrogenase-like Zn-dependent dehydrogenase